MGTGNSSPHRRQRRKADALLALCLVTWVGLPVIGLWPFDFSPANAVRWVRPSGLHFGAHGQVYSIVPRDSAQSDPALASGTPFSIEIWLQADRVCACVGTILSFYDPSQAKDFRIEQSISDLVVRGYFRDQHNRVGFRSLWLDGALPANRARFLTVTAGPQGASLYLEGMQARTYPYTPGANNLFGRLVLGHSPEGRSDWLGTVRGLAVYDRALTADEVLHHYTSWRASRTRELDARNGISGLYLFDEGSGDVVRNREGLLPDLRIPATFSVMRRTFLNHTFKAHSSDLEDTIINVAGFIPFGLLVSFYLSRSAGFSPGKAIATAVVLGGLTSLFIELLQAYLPSRDSSLLDLINNLLGTGLGAAFLKWPGRFLSPR